MTVYRHGCHSDPASGIVHTRRCEWARSHRVGPFRRSWLQRLLDFVSPPGEGVFE